MKKQTVIEAIKELFDECKTTSECISLEDCIYKPFMRIYKARIKEIEGPRPLPPDEFAQELVNKKLC